MADIETEIEGIPPTDWRFDTDDTAPWSWDEHVATDDQDDTLSDEAIRSTAIWTVIRCKEQGLSDREAAQFVPFSRQWVNARWNEFVEDGQHEETVDRGESIKEDRDPLT